IESLIHIYQAFLLVTKCSSELFVIFARLPKPMTPRSIDRLNILLMIASCILAFIFPFQLFLFSFAVLGPLHYFTEIPWLHGKKYYTSGKYDYLMLAALCCIIAVLHYITFAQDIREGILIRLLANLAFVAFFG